MTDNQIIKALQICVDDSKNCADCPAATEHNGCAEANDIKVIVDILTRQQAEIERFADIGKMYSEVRTDAIKEFAEVIHNYLLGLLKKWDELGDRKYELANMQVYNHIRSELDDLENYLKENHNV